MGVTDDTIRIGLNADLSGAFAPLVTQIVDGQEAYWEIVNENGGIAGRQVELEIIDNAYDVPTHMENYAEMADTGDEGVIMFSQSTGSPHTATSAPELVKDDLLAIPLSWYSGWAENSELGSNVMELYTNYCFEGMNGVEYLAGVNDATTIAIVSFPGEYGQDGAAGAKIAAEALGLEIVYDGEGAGRARRRPDPGDHRAGQRRTRHRLGDPQPDDPRRDPRRSVPTGPAPPSGAATRRPGTISCSPPIWPPPPMTSTPTRPTPPCGVLSTRQV